MLAGNKKGLLVTSVAEVVVGDVPPPGGPSLRGVISLTLLPLSKNESAFVFKAKDSFPKPHAFRFGELSTLCSDPAPSNSTTCQTAAGHPTKLVHWD